MRPDQKVVFGVSPRGGVDDDDGTFDVLLGVPLAAWEYMKDGKTHTFDLTKLGLPIRILLYGGPDQATVRAVVDEHNKSLGVTEVQDRRGEDFSIPDTTPDAKETSP